MTMWGLQKKGTGREIACRHEDSRGFASLLWRPHRLTLSLRHLPALSLPGRVRPEGRDTLSPLGIPSTPGTVKHIRSISGF